METENIKVCIFANPHNPTGRVWSEDELKQLGQIMVDNDVWIISDEIHCDIKRDGQTHVPLLKQCQITIRLLPQCRKVRHLI